MADHAVLNINWNAVDPVDGVEVLVYKDLTKVVHFVLEVVVH